MAPIRRYLRISKHSVLECRIFLENPADGPRWLLNQQDPALPRVFEAIRPLVLPKLREENARAKGKGKKKKSVKDVVSQDEFDVSIFLTQIATRHYLLTKSKTFKGTGRVSSNNNKLTGGGDGPIVIREESDGEVEQGGLDNVPSEDSDDFGVDSRSAKRSKTSKFESEAEELQEDDKKKLGFKTTYDGFSIWGWVLCLLVTRKCVSGKRAASSDQAGQALMEEWIVSTQPQQDEDG